MPLYRDVSRRWATSPESPLLSRPLSSLNIACRRDEVTGRIYTCLSHELLPTEFSSQPTDRTYFEPISIVTKPVTTSQRGDITEVPIIAAEAANVIVPELLSSGEVQLKVITLPSDDPAERYYHPQWYNGQMRPLEAPPELTLRTILIMSLDDAAGVLAIAVEGGDIFVLEY